MSVLASRTALRIASGGRKLGQLVVRQRDVVDRQLACPLSRRVGAHAVGHDEQVSPPAPLAGAAGRRDDERILIVRTAHSDVGDSSVLDAIVPGGRLDVHAVYGIRRLAVLLAAGDADGPVCVAETAQRRMTKD